MKSSEFLNKLKTWFLFILISCLSLALYIFQFEQSEAYTGVLPINNIEESSYWIFMCIYLGFCAFVFPSKINRPSDIFVVVYLLGVVIWNAAYWPITGLLDQFDAFCLMLILLFPIVSIKIFHHLVRKISMPNLFYGLNSNLLDLKYFLSFILAVSAILTYQIAGANGSFDISYERRMAGRESFESHLYIPYLFQMALNGVAPFQAFQAGLKKSIFSILSSVIFAIYAFWLLGLKAPFLSIFLMFFIGYLLRKNLLKSFPYRIVSLLIVFFLISITEIYFNDYSYLADYGFRRATLVVGQIQAYFYDAIKNVGFIIFNGIDLGSYTSPEFWIGEQYFNNPETNANTNAFLHQIAISGYLTYFFVILGISIFTLVSDQLVERRVSLDGYALCFLMGFLLIEQAFTTALVSSGLLLCGLLSFMFSQKISSIEAVEGKMYE